MKEFLKKIDIKNWVIIVLGIIIFTMLYFKKSNVDNYEKEINELKAKNEILHKQNDSILFVNDGIKNRIDSLSEEYGKIVTEISNKDRKIKDLEKKLKNIQNEVNNYNTDMLLLYWKQRFASGK